MLKKLCRAIRPKADFGLPECDSRNLLAFRTHGMQMNAPRRNWQGGADDKGYPYCRNWQISNSRFARLYSYNHLKILTI